MHTGQKGTAEAADSNIEVRHTEALLITGTLQSAIFNSANFTSIATDGSGVIQIFNVAKRMLDYTAADVVDKVTPADISDPLEVIARATATAARKLATARAEAILDVDRGRINDVNPFLIELLGSSHSEMVGTPIWELGPFRDIVSNKAKFEQLRQQGMFATKTCRWKRGMGATLTWSLSATCIQPVTAT